ncbi:hypothetical protein P154DRAFT_558309 [Amniculicola lignicola CBS 123094]|uniref:Uncharacterized protein n=1 Tax=Amniculicola lignicola CBS 123094 TaxID=1392246 RepID=A0A6A5X516_9PLEO|nr:hypothetical protein P154DRAFT_558309 [Amniculicola lignicola CBS 123094]
MTRAYAKRMFICFWILFVYVVNVCPFQVLQVPLGGVGDAAPGSTKHDGDFLLHEYDDERDYEPPNSNPGLYRCELPITALDAPLVAPPFVHGVTQCPDWLTRINGSIQYRYGENESHADNLALLECLQSSGAADARRNITEIFIVFPLFGTPPAYSKSLVNVAKRLPNFQEFRFPYAFRWRTWLLGKIPNRIRDAFKNKYFGDCYYYNERNIDQFINCDVKDIDPSKSRHQPSRQRNSRAEDHLYFSPPGYSAALKVLTECPTIESIYSGFWGDYKAPVFNFTDSKSMVARPKSVSMGSFNWSAPGYNAMNQAQTWAAKMDWSRVRNLKLGRFPDSFAEAFVGKLPQLADLTINVPPRWYLDEFSNMVEFDCSNVEWFNGRRSLQFDQQIWSDFTNSLPPLKALELVNLDDNANVFRRVLEKSRLSLVKLRIQNAETSYCMNNEISQWKGASAKDLRYIQEMTPNIRILAIDIEHDGRIPFESLKIISRWKHLEKLVLQLSPVNSWSYVEDEDTKVFMFNRTSIYSIFNTYFPTVNQLAIQVGERSYQYTEKYYERYGTSGATYSCSRENNEVKRRCVATGPMATSRGPGKWQSEGWI